MGNCQAAEMIMMAGAAVVEYPGGRVERVMAEQPLQGGQLVSAQRLMSSYPGYFVALISANSPTSAIVHPPAPPSKHTSMAAPPASFNPHAAASTAAPSFKLLSADAPLRSGHRYRLLSFEEVLTYYSQQGAGSFQGRPVIGPMNGDKRMASKLRSERSMHSLDNHFVKIGC